MTTEKLLWCLMSFFIGMEYAFMIERNWTAVIIAGIAAIAFVGAIIFNHYNSDQPE
jgi:hypothetical protein